MSSLKQETPVEVSFLRKNIDNPGFGNCAFYAFSIGLVHLIQHENAYKKRQLFNHWLQLDPAIGTLWALMTECEIDKIPKELLDKLQFSLRRIVFETQAKELTECCLSVHSNQSNQYHALIASSHFSQFAEIYYEPLVDSRFNVFASIPEIVAALDELKTKPVNPSDVSMELAKLFIRLHYGEKTLITKETKPLESSPILVAMKKVTVNYFWGTHFDLDKLARVFDLNFHPLKNGVAIHAFKDLEGKHTITINNQSNVHWITQVSVAQLKFSLKNHDEKKKTDASLTDEKNKKSTDELLKNLQRQVLMVSNDYMHYSSNIWCSLFHYHGETGRERALAFSHRFFKIKDYETAKITLINYLKNDRNGNTHPHSYRTMLLNQLMAGQNTLQSTSRSFLKGLTDLADHFNVPLNESLLTHVSML